MALIPLSINREPLGMFDAVDGVTFLGGEVCYLSSVTWMGADLAAQDVTEDGYVGTTGKNRPAVQLAGASGLHPLFLADDGSSNTYGNGYGTLFGTLVGATAGQVVTGGITLGPPSYSGSGKVTLIRPQSYVGVSLDAVDTTASTGLVPGNSTLNVGSALSYTTAGKLTPVTGGSPASGAPTVAYFEEFLTSGSLVNTPVDLVAALNSPSGSVQSASAKKFTMAALYFIGG